MSEPQDIQRECGAPLAGRSILVTRAREQAPELSERLEILGAEVLEWPVIRIVDPESWATADAAIDSLDTYDWVVFTSANAVHRFFDRLASRDLDARAFAGTAVAAVGKATAARLEAHGIRADYVPKKFVAEGVLEGFLERGVGDGSRILIPRAVEAREILPDTLRQNGAQVDIAPVYRTLRGNPAPLVVDALANGKVDAVIFTSASTVNNFVALLGEELALTDTVPKVLEPVTLASIGPVTSDALRAKDLWVDLQASPYTVPALVDALVELYAG